MQIRPATGADAPGMTVLLNRIIAIGGTTAHQRPFDVDRMLHHYIWPKGNLCCHVAEDGATILGFQSLIWPNDREDPFPDGWTIIASFVSPDHQGRGTGQALFAATAAKARDAGADVVDATIRADNTAGLRYYSVLGFRDYAILKDVPLRDGTRVDRIRKRYDL